MDGTTASHCHILPVWLAKGKAMEAFRSAIAGNEEIENLVQGFQLSDEERKEPDMILKHLQEHFMASEGVLTERTKFTQTKQQHQESVTAWEGRVKQQGRRLELIVINARTSYLETNLYLGSTTRD